jgi:nucleoside-diphosphate-sugar epimerase
MIAITGANGLVGSFIAKKLMDEGLPVMAVIRAASALDLLEGYTEKIIRREANVLDVPALTESFRGADTVIHAAGLVSFNPRQTRKVFDVNVEGTRNVVNACLALGIPRLIHISSVSALGRVKGVSTLNEESKWVPGPLNSDYAESKYLAELEVYRGMEEGLDVTLVSPSVILAPADWRKSSAQLFRYVWEEKSFYTEGSMNYVDVRDVAEMVFRIYRSNPRGQKFIASAGVISYKDFFDVVGKAFNKKPPSIKVSRGVAGLVAGLEGILSRLTGTEPMITRQTVRIASETFYYNHQKAIDFLEMDFRPLGETLDWCCAHYLRKVTINK